LLDPDDELFFGEFAAEARITQTWTLDRSLISRAVRNVAPAGGTAMYDAVAKALPLAAQGRHRKKALLVISDGNDTNSRISVDDVRRLIRESEVLVYALGVDSQVGQLDRSRPGSPWPAPFPFRPGQRPQLRLPIPPRPFPTPGGRRPQPGLPPAGGPTWQRSAAERVNAAALREITDDSGGRTEIVRRFSDLGAATARLAYELSQQYYLGYSSTLPRDGRWHAIRVQVRERDLMIRARRGYVAN
jgi:VWFA-related protein